LISIRDAQVLPVGVERIIGIMAMTGNTINRATRCQAQIRTQVQILAHLREMETLRQRPLLQPRELRPELVSGCF